jgi:hypothetical protein
MHLQFLNTKFEEIWQTQLDALFWLVAFFAFVTENGGIMFLRNIGELIANETPSHCKGQSLLCEMRSY